MEVQGERKDEDRGPSYEGGYLYSDICRTWDRMPLRGGLCHHFWRACTAGNSRVRGGLRGL